jgi:hypothetical protein
LSPSHRALQASPRVFQFINPAVYRSDAVPDGRLAHEQGLPNFGAIAIFADIMAAN